MRIPTYESLVHWCNTVDLQEVLNKCGARGWKLDSTESDKTPTGGISNQGRTRLVFTRQIGETEIGPKTPRFSTPEEVLSTDDPFAGLPSYDVEDRRWKTT